MLMHTHTQHPDSVVEPTSRRWGSVRFHLPERRSISVIVIPVPDCKFCSLLIRCPAVSSTNVAMVYSPKPPGLSSGSGMNGTFQARTGTRRHQRRHHQQQQQTEERVGAKERCASHSAPQATPRLPGALSARCTVGLQCTNPTAPPQHRNTATPQHRNTDATPLTFQSLFKCAGTHPFFLATFPARLRRNSSFSSIAALIAASPSFSVVVCICSARSTKASAPSSLYFLYESNFVW